MRRVYISLALSLLVLPGLGQIYNKDKKKGVFIICFLVTIMLILCISLANLIQPFMPGDISQYNFSNLMKIGGEIESEIIHKFLKPLIYYNLLIFGIYFYSAFDAGMTAYDKFRKEEAAKDGIGADSESG